MRLSFLFIGTLFFLLLSCASFREGRQISFKYYEKAKKRRILLDIPQGGKLVKISAGGEGEEHRYWYSDSAVIYISSLSGSETLNRPIILSSGYYNKWFSSDTASFTGVDNKGNFWKEVKKNKLVYGYANVPSSEKVIFEKALSSFR